jgi:hypothetical protein
MRGVKGEWEIASIFMEHQRFKSLFGKLQPEKQQNRRKFPVFWEKNGIFPEILRGKAGKTLPKKPFFSDFFDLSPPNRRKRMPAKTVFVRKQPDDIIYSSRLR